MLIRRRVPVGFCSAAGREVWRAQDHPAAEQYMPSDPALVGRTGKPQLVEFFHHL
jgi:hypothetical protein